MDQGGDQGVGFGSIRVFMDEERVLPTPQSIVQKNPNRVPPPRGCCSYSTRGLGLIQ